VLHRRPGHTGGVNRRDTVLAALVAALWGFNFVVIDWGLGTVPPLLFAAVRFTVVALPACLLVPRPPVPFRTVAAVGAFMSLGQFGLLYLSLHLGMPPGLAALVLQAQVPFTIALAAAVLREPPSRAQVAGVGLGAGGLVVVALGIGGSVAPVALALCLLAGLSWGIGNVVSRAARPPGGLALTVWSATVAPVPLLGLSLLIDGPAAVGRGLSHFGWHAALSTAYTAGLCSLVGYAVFNRLLSRYPSGQVVPWVLLAPVVAMASSWALLGEAPGPAELAGAALLVAGVLIAQGAPRRRPFRPVPAGGEPGAPGAGEPGSRPEPAAARPWPAGPARKGHGGRGRRAELVRDEASGGRTAG
jgi:O-acetylserine/cysteine efflux transporter